MLVASTGAEGASKQLPPAVRLEDEMEVPTKAILPNSLLVPVNVYIGSMNRELIRKDGRLVIACSVSGEKPKRMPGSGRRTAASPIRVRSEVELTNPRSKAKCGTVGENRLFSGLRAGNRSSNAAYVPVECHKQAKTTV
jgi:hypothetical protein